MAEISAYRENYVDVGRLLKLNDAISKTSELIATKIKSVACYSELVKILCSAFSGTIQYDIPPNIIISKLWVVCIPNGPRTKYDMIKEIGEVIIDYKGTPITKVKYDIWYSLYVARKFKGDGGATTDPSIYISAETNEPVALPMPWGSQLHDEQYVFTNAGFTLTFSGSMDCTYELYAETFNDKFNPRLDDKLSNNSILFYTVNSYSVLPNCNGLIFSGLHGYLERISGSNEYDNASSSALLEFPLPTCEATEGKTINKTIESVEVSVNAVKFEPVLFDECTWLAYDCLGHSSTCEFSIPFGFSIQAFPTNARGQLYLLESDKVKIQCTSMLTSSAKALKELKIVFETWRIYTPEKGFL